MLNRLFKPRPATVAGEALYAAAIAQARKPDFYRDMGVADTREGRFELYSLHVILLLERLKGQGVQGEEAAKVLLERFIRGLDDAFRELGVGDVGVAKKVNRLAEAFYGRAHAFQEAVQTLPDVTPLRALLARTVLEEREADVDGLTAYVLKAREGLAGQDLANLLAGSVTWEAAS